MVSVLKNRTGRTRNGCMVSVLKQNWRDVAVALESLVGHSPIPPGHLYRSGNVDFCSHQVLLHTVTLTVLESAVLS